MPGLASARQDAALDAITPGANSGKIQLMDSGNTVLVEWDFDTTAFAAASGGTANATIPTVGVSALATGTIDRYQIVESNGTTVVYERNNGDSKAAAGRDAVAISGGTADIVLGVASLAVTSGQSFTITNPVPLRFAAIT